MRILAIMGILSFGPCVPVTAPITDTAVDGDSISTVWPDRLVEAPTYGPILKYAVSGSRCSDLETRVWDPLQSGHRRIATIWCGTNAIQAQVSVSDCVTHLAGAVAHARANGATWVIVATMLDRNWQGSDSTPAQEVRDAAAAYNLRIRNEYNTTIGADQLLDFSAMPEWGVDGAYADHTYFEDGIHPSNNGQTIIAGHWDDALAEARVALDARIGILH